MEFVELFLPYVVRRHPDGRVSVMNRNYQDPGVPDGRFGSPSYPRRHFLSGAGHATLKKASISQLSKTVVDDDHPESGTMYHLHDGYSRSWKRPDFDAYCDRLWKLRGVKRTVGLHSGEGPRPWSKVVSDERKRKALLEEADLLEKRAAYLRARAGER